MRMFTLRSLLALALLAGTVTVGGCYAHAVGPDGVVVGSYGYEPMYFNGFMVYYDNVGRPFYYYNGAQVYIAATSPYYATYVSHYRTYAGPYARWYSAGGYRYRTYRGSVGYYGGHRGHVNHYRRAPVRTHRHR